MTNSETIAMSAVNDMMDIMVTDRMIADHPDFNGIQEACFGYAEQEASAILREGGSTEAAYEAACQVVRDEIKDELL